MKKILQYLYRIQIVNIIEITENTRKIVTDKSTYILKKVDSLNKENIYIRLSLSKVPYFNLPLKSVRDRYVEEIDREYYILSYYYKDESMALEELRMSFYLKAIAMLHQNTLYPLKVNDGYFAESLHYIETRILSVREEIDARMFNVERSEYHSPSDWYYLSCYRIFNNALNEAQKYLDSLNEEFEKLHSVELSLTYQNYQLDHILLKEEKIVSLEKVAFSPPVYDLVDFVEKNYHSSVDISRILSAYTDIHPLYPYQKYWLLALLFIPKINKETEDIRDIESLFLSLNYLEVTEKIRANLLNQTESA